MQHWKNILNFIPKFMHVLKSPIEIHISVKFSTQSIEGCKAKKLQKLTMDLESRYKNGGSPYFQNARNSLLMLYIFLIAQNLNHLSMFDNNIKCNLNS
jgi:hypothetical protein